MLGVVAVLMQGGMEERGAVDQARRKDRAGQREVWVASLDEGRDHSDSERGHESQSEGFYLGASDLGQFDVYQHRTTVASLGAATSMMADVGHRRRIRCPIAQAAVTVYPWHGGDYRR
jgi:hypothetical protein